jgi:hypothetical protein
MSATRTAADRAEIVRKWLRYADDVKQLAAARRRRAPAVFRATPSGQTTGRTRSTRSPAPPPATSRVRHRRVLFSDLAMDALRDMPYDNGFESGCGLYGVRHDNGDITIWGIGRTHTDDQMTRVRLDPQDLREDGAHFLRGQNWDLVGDLHVHPRWFENGIQASNNDRDAWRLIRLQGPRALRGCRARPELGRVSRLAAADPERLDRGTGRQSAAGRRRLQLGRMRSARPSDRACAAARVAGIPPLRPPLLPAAASRRCSK